MCGITGIIGLTNDANAEPERIVKMTDMLVHRGPDGEGFLFSSQHQSGFMDLLKTSRPKASVCIAASPRNVMMGHRRLSIIDLSDTAAQPMSDVTEKYWIVFNGEIYNHREIRKELEASGYRFKTDHSDTEVILNAYAAWGIECLERLRGMFAFVLWDVTDDCFYMVRDRLGIKPLFYCISQNKLYFSSEIKAILTDPSIPRKLNRKSLYDYLSFTFVPPPHTLFEYISKLPAAHYIKIRKDGIAEPVQYWQPFTKGSTLTDEDEILERLYEKLKESVDIRREADVEYGALLSGGVDSSATVALLSDLGKKPVKAFTVGFSNDIANYSNEFEHARKIARKFNTRHFEIELNDTHFHEFMVNMLNNLDEPLADTACIPIYYIAKLAKENGVTVLLGGEGSDELLLGYDYWFLSYDFQKLTEKFYSPALLKLAGKTLNLPYLKNKRPYYRNWIERIKNNQPVFWGGSELRSPSGKDRIVTDAFSEQLNGYSTFDSISDYYNKFNSDGSHHFMNWMSYIDLNVRLPELLLARLDRMTMAASVEGRVPFLDHEFVELCMRIDAPLKVKKRTGKYLLKKAFEGVLPKDILYREKDGFTVPTSRLLFGNELESYGRDQIKKFNIEHQVFKDEYITALFDQQKDVELWNVLNLALSSEGMKIK